MIQASAQEPKDVRMWGHKQVKHIKHVGYYNLLHTSLNTLYANHMVYLYISNYILVYDTPNITPKFIKFFELNQVFMWWIVCIIF